MNDEMEISVKAAKRLREFRKVHRITQEQAAEGYTKYGCPMSRESLANVETERVRSVSIDLVFAAAGFYKVGLWDFFHGPLCGQCRDEPPIRFICTVCGKEGKP